jgi:hypothetical protein
MPSFQVSENCVPHHGVETYLESLKRVEYAKQIDARPNQKATLALACGCGSDRAYKAGDEEEDIEEGNARNQSAVSGCYPS